MLFLKTLKSNRHKITHSGTSWLLFTAIKSFVLLKVLKRDLDSVRGPNAYSLMHFIMEYMTEVAVMHLPPINHCQSFLQRDMENEKYSNLNSGGQISPSLLLPLPNLS